MMRPTTLNTPVLLLVFNRLDTTKKVFDAIRKAKPRQLFIAADGPREDRPDDLIKTQQVREFVAAVDWECRVETLFRTENLGPGRGPCQAISWFFEQVDRGIILEDDCLPAESFFFFCEELLEKYKNDERVQSIAGTNQFVEWPVETASYFFALQSGIWGWATWRRAWAEYDFSVQRWGHEEVKNKFLGHFANVRERKNYEVALGKAYRKERITWWDYQWIFSRVISSRVGIVPKTNLVSNIGFGTAASHTMDEDSMLSSLPVKDIEFPLVHPSSMMADQVFDKKHSNTFYPVQKSSRKQQLKGMVKQWLGRH